MAGDDDGLMDGGARGAKFEKVGDFVEGVVETVEKRQCTDMQSGKPLWWDEEKTQPKEQFIFTLQTQLREDEDDDGRRRVYAKKPGKMLTAIQGAVRTAKHKGSTIGGTLKVGFTGTETPEKKGFSPAKCYRARFTPPAANADDWGDEAGTDRDEPGGDNAAPAATTRSQVPF